MEWRTPENIAMQTRRILGRRKKGKAEEREVEKNASPQMTLLLMISLNNIYYYK